MPGPLDAAQVVTKLPAQDLDCARDFYRVCLGLEPAEEREGGLRYLTGTSEFHGSCHLAKRRALPPRMGFEVEDIDRAVEELRSRGVQFESFDIASFDVDDDIVTVPNN